MLIRVLFSKLGCLMQPKVHAMLYTCISCSKNSRYQMQKYQKLQYQLQQCLQ